MQGLDRLAECPQAAWCDLCSNRVIEIIADKCFPTQIAVLISREASVSSQPPARFVQGALEVVGEHLRGTQNLFWRIAPA